MNECTLTKEPHITMFALASSMWSCFSPLVETLYNDPLFHFLQECKPIITSSHWLKQTTAGSACTHEPVF